MQVDNVGLAVRDVEAVFAFFSGPLGLEVQRYADGSGSVQFEGSSLYVFQTPEADASPPRRPDLAAARPGLDHISFRVDDVDAAHAELAARGVQFIEGPVSKPDWGLRVAAFNDPERNLYFLIKPLES
jgi:catechol 2,3-dioxygenase-like lactoylglutathione lyase family enzyme